MKTQKKYTATQWQMRHMLNDVVEHFSKDPRELRSIAPFMGMCLYHPPVNKPKSIGCAIGMYLPENVCRKMDKQKNGTAIADFFVGKRKAVLPKWMQKMDVKFLTSVQNLHDNSWNWSGKGLSEGGKEYVAGIIKTHNLPKTIYG